MIMTLVIRYGYSRQVWDLSPCAGVDVCLVVICYIWTEMFGGRMEKIFLREAVSGAEGEGVEVRRLFPVHGFMNYDPFVLWDNFTVPPTAGFPDHPHRGFEGITYVIAGEMLHKDNLGNASKVKSGGLQRFTAGKGIVHSEMPSENGVTTGIQMWVNLPHRLKKVAPDYQQVDPDAIPEYSIDGGRIRVLAGDNSPLQLMTPVRYLDVQLSPGGKFEDILPDSFRGFIYVIEGNIRANDKVLSDGSALFCDKQTALSISSDTDSRFMVCFGQPHGEPIYQRGPYVD